MSIPTDPRVIAAQYDALAGPAWFATYPFSRLHARSMVAQLQAVGFKDGDSVLDLGCGPGHLLVEIHRTAPKSRVCGVDISVKLMKDVGVNLARVDADDSKVRGYDYDITSAGFVQWLQGELGDKFRFDWIVCDTVLGHVDRGRHARLLSDWSALLKTGGHFVFSLNHHPLVPGRLTVRRNARTSSGIPQCSMAMRVLVAPRSLYRTTDEQAKSLVESVSGLTFVRIINQNAIEHSVEEALGQQPGGFLTGSELQTTLQSVVAEGIDLRSSGGTLGGSVYVARLQKDPSIWDKVCSKALDEMYKRSPSTRSFTNWYYDAEVVCSFVVCKKE